jgi:hypothetical protein
MGDIVPRNELVKQGVNGVGGIAGGTAILVLSSFGGVWGWLIGAALTAAGLYMSRKKTNRTAGTLTAGAGIITLVSRLPVIGWLVHLGGWGLIAMGGWSLFKFFKNLRKRS